MKTWLSLIVILTATASFASDYSWHDTEGKYMDLRIDGVPVIRYQYEAIDESSPERRHDTYKPFHHVFDADGKDFITKGPGGKFSHHRGIYFGFSKCSYTDSEGKVHKNIDTWHCKKAHQVHKKLIKKSADEKSASMTSEIAWIDNEGAEFATEIRTLTFSKKENGDLVVDFDSVVTPLHPAMRVDGDPQHAGFQFRANNEVAESTAKQTYYIRPGSGKAAPGKTINWSSKLDNETTRDLPWKGMSFVTGGNRYSVAYIDSPQNPKPARYSERDYGRFGSYFFKDISPAEPLKVQYKLVIRSGEMTQEEIESFEAP